MELDFDPTANLPPAELDLKTTLERVMAAQGIGKYAPDSKLSFGQSGHDLFDLDKPSSSNVSSKQTDKTLVKTGGSSGAQPNVSGIVTDGDTVSSGNDEKPVRSLSPEIMKRNMLQQPQGAGIPNRDRVASLGGGRSIAPSHYSNASQATSSGIHQSFELIPPPVECIREHQNIQAKERPVPPDRDFGWLKPITEPEVREALVNEARRHSSWRLAAAKKLVISDVQMFTSLHYILETFCEWRSTSRATEAYSMNQYLESTASALTGGSLEMTADGQPDYWSLPCQPRGNFIEDVRLYEVPGSSDLTACHSCSAEGYVLCFYCRGTGTDKCKACRGTGMKAGIAHPAVYTHPMVGTPAHGSGLSRGHGAHRHGVGPVPHSGGNMAFGAGTPMHYMNVSGMPPPGIGAGDLCFFCHGRGLDVCSHCKGKGKRACSVCAGSGSTRTFVKLKINFGVDKSDYFHLEGGVPEEMLQKATGETILVEEGPIVIPLRTYPIDEVNENSKRLCQVHLQKCLGAKKILLQKHTLQAIPVAEVTYTFGSKQSKFWVYGQERFCYVPHYPSKCSIL